MAKVNNFLQPHIIFHIFFRTTAPKFVERHSEATLRVLRNTFCCGCPDFLLVFFVFIGKNCYICNRIKLAIAREAAHRFTG
ncbi:MAG: hypothetical protein IJV05_03740, partial [Muribaculaceae bacterium]|nr:hypothetical protein [Muribaculaceae bacterium]